MKLVYPAIFYPYESGDGYVVEFPDLPGCITQGESIEEAFEMAADAASGWIFTSIEEGEDLPKPSSDLKISDFEDAVLINYILLDMDSYAKQYSNKAIKKTLTIPQWLNTLAERENINFSQLLQNALKRELALEPEPISRETNSKYETIIQNLQNIVPLLQNLSEASKSSTSYDSDDTEVEVVAFVPYMAR